MALPAVKFSATSLAAALVQTVVPTQSVEGGFLKFDGKVGGWSYGREQEAADGEIILVNTPSIGHGWVMWVDSQPKEKRLTRFNEPMPEPMEAEPVKIKKGGKLIDEMKEPDECRVLQGAFLEDGEPVTFETSSYSGRAAIDTLLSEIKQKAVSGSEYLFPAVKLCESSYYNKTHKTDIYTPVLEVVSWHDQDGNPEPGEQDRLEDSSQVDDQVEYQGAAQSQEPTKPAKAARKPRSTKASAPAEEPKTEAPAEPAAPARRRRTVA